MTAPVTALVTGSVASQVVDTPSRAVACQARALAAGAEFPPVGGGVWAGSDPALKTQVVTKTRHEATMRGVFMRPILPGPEICGSQLNSRHPARRWIGFAAAGSVRRRGGDRGAEAGWRARPP